MSEFFFDGVRILWNTVSDGSYVGEVCKESEMGMFFTGGILGFRDFLSA
jgi:hypothetical protein